MIIIKGLFTQDLDIWEPGQIIKSSSLLKAAFNHDNHAKLKAKAPNIKRKKERQNQVLKLHTTCTSAPADHPPPRTPVQG